MYCDKLLNHLRDGVPVLVLTLGADGFPNSAFTWALALDARRVRFCVDHESATLKNLERDAHCSIQIIGPEKLVFLLKGIVHRIKERMNALPVPAALMEMDIVAGKDQAWRGVTAAPLAYEWDEPERAAMRAMEQTVYAEMRTAEDGFGEHGCLHRAV